MLKLWTDLLQGASKCLYYATGITLALHIHITGLNLGQTRAKAVRRSPPTAGVPSSRLCLSMWVSWFLGVTPISPTTNSIPPFLHTLLIHFVSFNFIRPCVVASGVVCRHPCYSQAFNKEASTHFNPGPGPVSDTTWGYKYYLVIEIINPPKRFLQNHLAVIIILSYSPC